MPLIFQIPFPMYKPLAVEVQKPGEPKITVETISVELRPGSAPYPVSGTLGKMEISVESIRFDPAIGKYEAKINYKGEITNGMTRTFESGFSAYGMENGGDGIHILSDSNVLLGSVDVASIDSNSVKFNFISYLDLPKREEGIKFASTPFYENGKANFSITITDDTPKNLSLIVQIADSAGNLYASTAISNLLPGYHHEEIYIENPMNFANKEYLVNIISPLWGVSITERMALTPTLEYIR